MSNYGNYNQRAAGQAAAEAASRVEAKERQDAALEAYRLSLGLPSQEQVAAVARARSDSLRQQVAEHLQRTAPDLAAAIAANPSFADITGSPAPAQPATPQLPDNWREALNSSQKILLGLQIEQSQRQQAGQTSIGPAGQPPDASKLTSVQKIQAGLSPNPGSDRLRY